MKEERNDCDIKGNNINKEYKEYSISQFLL